MLRNNSPGNPCSEYLRRNEGLQWDHESLLMIHNRINVRKGTDKRTDRPTDRHRIVALRFSLAYEKNAPARHHTEVRLKQSALAVGSGDECLPGSYCWCLVSEMLTGTPVLRAPRRR